MSVAVCHCACHSLSLAGFDLRTRAAQYYVGWPDLVCFARADACASHLSRSGQPQGPVESGEEHRATLLSPDHTIGAPAMRKSNPAIVTVHV